MSNFFKLISIFIISISLLFANLNFSFNLNIQAKTKEITISKKQLKKVLSLNYTNPKFENDLNSDQKSSILKALKKWKGELPIDNKFTVTSIADLKSETNSEGKNHRKKSSKTSNAKIIYMWSQTLNPNFDPKNPNESEEGDPRFINAQFNVLIKQNKNGTWKASIERDPEVKTESVDITETDEDAQIYKDLFATDNTDNEFTATEDVLIEDSNTLFETPSKSTAINTIISSTSSSATLSSLIIPIISPTESNPTPVQKEKTSWLQNILRFGSISANAQVTQQYNYSWPWKGGDTWAIGQGWHDCELISPSNGNLSYTGSPTGCALDVQPVNTNNIAQSDTVLAPITGAITRSCNDGVQGMYKFGNMSVLHLSASSMLNGDGAFVRKGDNVGKVFNPNIFPKTDPRWTVNGFSTLTNNGNGILGCGITQGSHLHIKISSITNPVPNHTETDGSVKSENMFYQNLIGSTTIDGKYLQGAKITPIRADNKQNYNPFGNIIDSNSTFLTSQNYSNTNTYTGKIKSFNTPNKIFDIYDFNGNNGAAVQLYEAGTNNPVNQRWYFDDVNRQVKGMNGKCLEVASTNYIKMQDCTATASQKWQFNSNNQIISEANSMCIEAQSGIIDGSLLIVNTCNTSNNNQKWNFADIVIITSGSTRINTRVNLAGPWNTTTKLMNKELNTNNKIPLLQPFCTSPWNYCGTENIPSRANIDQSAVDWVLIEIKNTSGTIVQRKAALITNDAFLTDANGINSPGNFYPVKFSSISSPGYYKIIVRHRNHLAIATDSNVYLTQSTSPSVYNNIDLTKNVNVKGLNQANLGTNSAGQTAYGMRLGDANADGVINATDRTLMFDAQEGFYYSSYDLNLDANVNSTDRQLIQVAQEAVSNL
jgi:hypothetical protein